MKEVKWYRNSARLGSVVVGRIEKRGDVWVGVVLCVR